MSDNPRRNERCPHGIRWPHECKDCLYGSELAAPAGSVDPLDDQPINCDRDCVSAEMRKIAGETLRRAKLR